ncbi:hypothetical protein BGZ63DRAFT_394632 [Mariannaea sp. PMI_226]|nr:hypothetical protein BGZ63DRAFT_394632 [Mariannaea sp. PMI_226]
MITVETNGSYGGTCSVLVFLLTNLASTFPPLRLNIASSHSGEDIPSLLFSQVWQLLRILFVIICFL